MGEGLDAVDELCDSPAVRSFRLAIGFIFVIALFLGGGASGACSIWSVAGISHDHHQGQEAVVVFEEEGQCEQPSVPCNDANDESPDLRFSLPAPFQKPFSTQLIGVLPTPTAQFDIPLPAAHFEPLLLRGFARLSPVSRQVLFCRFLI